MSQTIVLTSNLIKYDGLNKIVEIKEFRANKLRTAFKSINGEIMYDIRKYPTQQYEKGLSKLNTQQLVKEIETKEFQGTINGILERFSSFSKNKKIKKIIFKLVILALLLALTLYHHPASAGTLGTIIDNTTNNTILSLPEPAISCLANAGKSQPVTAEFSETYRFISYIITLMRGLIATACGLIVANTSLKIVTEENSDGHREAKKSFQKIFWALFLAFAGVGIAQMIAKKVLSGGI